MKQARVGAASRRQTTTVEGLVVRTEAGHHRVLAGDRIFVCRAAKKLLLGERTATTAVVIGDRVRARVEEDSTGLIEQILPRRNELVRGAAGGRHFLDVIAANLDQLVAVHSLKVPDFNPARFDRFILIGEAAEIPVVAVVNKVDLADPETGEMLARRYRAAGYATILTSAKQGIGIADLRDALTGKISALLGPSGTGKSTLLNRVQPGLRLRTGEISQSTGKGRHTTTTAELLALSDGGWVADTPGLREVAIRDVTPPELEWLFPEFRPYLGCCRFTNCSHRQELGCAVRQAVEQNRISSERYESYRRVYEDLEQVVSY